MELGADGVELDVHASADARLVVMHDVTLRPDDFGERFGCDERSADIKRLDAGSWFGAEHAGEPVPFLEDVLQLTAERFEIQLKGFTAEFVDAVVDTVLAEGALERVEFTSSEPLLLAMVRRRLPGARIGVFAPPVEEWMPWDVHLLRTRALVELVEVVAQIVHFAAQHVDAAIVAVVDSWGYGLHAADVADRDLDRVLELGVTRLTTNNPGLAIARRAARPGAG
jgi:glycerophosphoryl diester phosphodiesterase